MKISFKTTTLIAAIGMIVYTIYVVTRYVIHQLSVVRYNFDLWEDICALDLRHPARQSYHRRNRSMELSPR